MTRLFIKLLIITILINSCTSRSLDKKAEINILRTTKINLIHDLIKKVGFVSLPYKAVFNASTDGTYRIQCWGKDSILCDDFRGNDSYVIGTLPDTSNYYSFIFITISAIAKPNLITYDKNGNRISFKPLTEENSVIYVGDILECEEYAIIDRDLKIKSYFKSRVANETTTIDVYDTVCTHYETNGYIKSNGEIVFEKRQEISCE